MTPPIVIPAECFPLTWPTGIPRARFHQQTEIGKRITLGDAIEGVYRELRLMRVGTSVISSNLPPRRDNTPRGDAAPRDGDHGVAVYWSKTAQRGGERVKVPYVMTCDRYPHIRQNLRAIAMTLEALRGMDRWGACSAEQAFAGFAALPPASGDEATVAPAERPWREVLAVPSDGWAATAPAVVVLDFARRQHRAMIKLAHPDAGGTQEAAAEINRAIEQAEAELAEPQS